jgi:prepilin-type N-terminal cleavage/methylation domain-containing protein
MLRHRRNQGFTLLELAVVVIILAVLSSIAVPRYGRAIANYRASSAARRVAADIALTQARARALSTSQSIVFSTSQNNYQITGMADPDHPASTYTVGLSDLTAGASLTGASFGQSSTLTFNGYGIPAAGGTITLTSGAATRTITVAADSGAATVR